MDKKADLAKLLGVEKLIRQKTVIDESKATTDDKTPYQLSQDIKIIVDMMNAAVLAQDVAAMVLSTTALVDRASRLHSSAMSIQKKISGN